MQNKTDWFKVFGFFLIPFPLFLFSFIILFLGFYDSLPWIDIPFHILGGLLVGITISLTLGHFQEVGRIKLDRLSMFIFVVSFVGLITVLWEFFEFLLTYFTGMSFQGTLDDTMLDFFLGICGGVASALFFVYNRR